MGWPNRTLTAKFHKNIIENRLNLSLDFYHLANYLKFIVTSDYPIASPITITYSVQGEYFIDKQDEWGSQQPPTEPFQSRDWTRTLSAGQSRWEFTEQPDRYDTLEPGLPGKASITSAEGGFIFNEFSDSKYHYLLGENIAEL